LVISSFSQKNPIKNIPTRINTIKYLQGDSGERKLRRDVQNVEGFYRPIHDALTKSQVFALANMADAA
jgi:hypothetical protein